MPEDFLGDNFKTAIATGITDKGGLANMSIPRPEPDYVLGVPPGFYSVEITKPGENIPAKYNSQTIFGLEIAPDMRLLQTPEFQFDIGKK